MIVRVLLFPPFSFYYWGCVWCRFVNRERNQRRYRSPSRPWHLKPGQPNSGGEERGGLRVYFVHVIGFHTISAWLLTETLCIDSRSHSFVIFWIFFFSLLLFLSFFVFALLPTTVGQCRLCTWLIEQHVVLVIICLAVGNKKSKLCRGLDRDMIKVCFPFNFSETRKQQAHVWRVKMDMVFMCFSLHTCLDNNRRIEVPTTRATSGVLG